MQNLIKWFVLCLALGVTACSYYEDDTKNDAEEAGDPQGRWYDGDNCCDTGTSYDGGQGPKGVHPANHQIKDFVCIATAIKRNPEDDSVISRVSEEKKVQVAGADVQVEFEYESWRSKITFTTEDDSLDKIIMKVLQYDEENDTEEEIRSIASGGRASDLSLVVEASEDTELQVWCRKSLVAAFY